MGFDLVGIKPKNDTGKEFRNNVWYWKPLWHLVANNTHELNDKDKQEGQFNNGHKIDGNAHKGIVETLRRLLRERPHDEVQRALAQSQYIMIGDRKIIASELSIGFGLRHQFEWSNLELFLEFCENNEGFTIN